jgi:hypothetical protein
VDLSRATPQRTDDFAAWGPAACRAGSRKECPWVPCPARGPAARRPEGQATRGRGQDLGRRVIRLITALGLGARRTRPQVPSGVRRETTSGKNQRHRGGQDVLWSGQPRGSRPCPGRRGSGTSLSSFRGWVRTDRSHGACLDRDRGEVEPVTTIAFPSDPEITRAGCAKRRGARSSCHAPSSRRALQDARRGAWPCPQDVPAARPPQGLSLSRSLP